MLRITPQLNAEAAKNYQATHLSKGDYYLSESNYGHWQGEGAERLGLKEGAVISKKDYDLLCENKRPDTGTKLTLRNVTNRRVAYDFTFSVPKDVSVLAYTTGDQRIVDAFHESCRYTMKEVEREACVRQRKHGADTDRKSGNLIIAEFRHDTSRPVGKQMPDPHLHAHYVVFNASYDPVEKKFKAVQFGELKRDGPYYQEVQINRFVHSMRELGYRLVASRNGFYCVEGLPPSLTENFSKRSTQIEQEIARRGLAKGSKLAKEVTLQTRQHKLKGLSRDELVQAWKSAMTPEDRKSLESVRSQATFPLPKEGITPDQAFKSGIDHCFERKSVVRDAQILQAALKAGRGEVDLEALKRELHDQEYKKELWREDRELTTSAALQAERYYLQWAKQGREKHAALGVIPALPSFLNKDQIQAIQTVLRSKDTVVGLIGDAGTGKTTILPEIIRGLERKGNSVYVCAPSASAKAVLQKEVIPQADTLQKLLVDPHLQEQVKGQVILVDEAGFISSRQMRDLSLLAEKNDHRLVLMGDPKQHASVEAGDAFRALMKYGKMQVSRLQEIQRQRNPVYKEAVRELAQGHVLKSLEHFASCGAVREIKESQAMFEKAAADYVQATGAGKSCLAVIPVWSEIHTFSDVVREKLKQAGQLKGEEKAMTTYRSYRWTEAERTQLRNYAPGDVLTFPKVHPNFIQHETALVIERQKEWLLVEKPSGERVVFQPTTKALFDVGTTEKLGVAVGEKLLIRANLREDQLVNGEIVQVREHRTDGSLGLMDGRSIPATFQQFAYGYANTSHAAQGKTVDHGILLMGEKGIQAGDLRQAYVSNSRFRESQSIYTTNLKAAQDAMATEKDRKLAFDLIRRRKTTWKKALKHLRQKSTLAPLPREAVTEKPTPSQKLDWRTQQEKQTWGSKLSM